MDEDEEATQLVIEAIFDIRGKATEIHQAIFSSEENDDEEEAEDAWGVRCKGQIDLAGTVTDSEVGKMSVVAIVGGTGAYAARAVRPSRPRSTTSRRSGC